MQRTTTLTPLALKDAPALIETVFPAQKVSFEAQKGRKANLGQTLTGLGSYWKGRKPLILVRAIVLGTLLPPTDDAEADLAIFEKLMAFDDEGLARRALAANAFSVSKLQEMIPISDPERYFGGRGWRRDITDDARRWPPCQVTKKRPASANARKNWIKTGSSPRCGQRSTVTMLISV